jgi:hypothetical protein
MVVNGSHNTTGDGETDTHNFSCSTSDSVERSKSPTAKMSNDQHGLRPRQHHRDGRFVSLQGDTIDIRNFQHRVHLLETGGQHCGMLEAGYILQNHNTLTFSFRFLWRATTKTAPIAGKLEWSI